LVHKLIDEAHNKAISSLVWDREISLPTSLRHISISITTSSSALLNVVFRSTWVLVGLHVILHVSCSKSLIYFCWDMKIPFLEWATSIPRKSFSFRKVLISNSLTRHWLNLCYFFLFVISNNNDIILIDQQYFTPPELECLINKVWSPWLCLYLRLIMTLVNLPNHVPGDYFNLYTVFFSLQTMF